MESRDTSRLETIGKGVVVIGILVGLGALGVIFLGGIFDDTPDAPPTARLAPLLDAGTVVFDRERDDLSPDGGGRTVLLSVPRATNQGAAVRAMLLLLRDARWLVSGRGGVISPDGSVCAVVSTPASWLQDDANGEFHDALEKAFEETDSPGAVLDLFFCSTSEGGRSIP